MGRLWALIRQAVRNLVMMIYQVYSRAQCPSYQQLVLSAPNSRERVC